MNTANDLSQVSSSSSLSSQSSNSNVALIANSRDALLSNAALPDLLQNNSDLNEGISEEVSNLLMQVRNNIP